MTSTGLLRDRVTLLSPETIADAAGGQTTAWVDGPTVWAAILPVSGRELVAAGGLQSALSTWITLHYREDVTARQRVRRDRDGQVFEIVGPPRDPDGRRIWLQLDAIEVQP